MVDLLQVNIPENEMPSLNELPGDLPEIAEIIGVSLTLKLANRFRGSSVYFHNTDAIFRKHRDNKIRNQYDNGITAVKLGRKYRLSTRQVEQILSRLD